MNSSKGIKNLIWGIVAQVVTIGLGIIIPRLVLVNLGSESNGLLNSVNSILSYMTLLEAGVGTVTLQALYKPFADDDKNAINRIMAATHYFYKRTGFAYLLIVSFLSVGYTFLVSTSLPKIYVFLVVILSGLSGVISYFFQGKFRIFLAAEGKSYLISNINTITTVGVSVFKALLLIAGGNVVLIQTVYFVFNLVQMLYIVIYMHKKYPWIDLNVKPNLEALSQKKAVMVHQISSLIFYNTDNIILTAFTSLKVVSVYSMYAMIFGMVKSVVITISESFVYALGQSYSDKKKFLRLFNAYEVYHMSIAFSLFCIAGILITPFMKLYTAGVNDINYIDWGVVILFLTYYLLDNGRKSSLNVISIAQHFDKTKWRAIIEASINLVTSIVLTIKFGIYGVLLGTIAALLYRSNDAIIYASKLLKRSALITYRRWILNIALFIVFFVAATRLDLVFDNYASLIVYGVVLCCIIIPSFIGVNSLFEPETAKYTFTVVKNLVKSKLLSRRK